MGVSLTTCVIFIMMTFRGKYPIRFKIVLQEDCLELQLVCGTIWNIFENKIRTDALIKLYQVLTITIFYGNEAWALTRKKKLSDGNEN